MRDLHNNIKLVQHLLAAVYTSTQTPSNGVDRALFQSVEFVISIGALAGLAASPPVGNWTFKLQESDSLSTGFTDVVTASDTITGGSQSPAGAVNASTGVFLTVDAAAEDDKVYRIGYIGTKRYVRCVATAADTPGNTPVSIVAILGHPLDAPQTDA